MEKAVWYSVFNGGLSMITNSFNLRNIKRLVALCSLFSFMIAGNVFSARPGGTNAHKHCHKGATGNVEKPARASFFGRCRSWLGRREKPSWVNSRNVARLFWVGLAAATMTSILGNDGLDRTSKVLAISGIWSVIFTLSRFSSAIDKIGGTFRSARNILDGMTRDSVKGVLREAVGGEIRDGISEELGPLRERATQTLDRVRETAGAAQETLAQVREPAVQALNQVGEAAGALRNGGLRGVLFGVTSQASHDHGEQQGRAEGSREDLRERVSWLQQ